MLLLKPLTPSSQKNHPRKMQRIRQKLSGTSYDIIKLFIPISSFSSFAISHSPCTSSANSLTNPSNEPADLSSNFFFQEICRLRYVYHLNFSTAGPTIEHSKAMRERRESGAKGGAFARRRRQDTVVL